MVTELCSGPCIAMEIIQPEPPKVFRDFCGPSDPVSTCLSDKECLKKKKKNMQCLYELKSI